MLYSIRAVSYTHLRAHETPEHLVCRLLLENYGYQMKKRHGNGTRRIVKYDIIERNLMLCYKPPNSDEWTRITPPMAQIRKIHDNQNNLREYESQLSLPDNKTVKPSRPTPLQPPSNPTGQWTPGAQPPKDGPIPTWKPADRSL